MGLKVNQYSTRLITRGSSLDGETIAINVIFLMFVVGFAKPFLFNNVSFGIATFLFSLMALAVSVSIVVTLISIVRDHLRILFGWFIAEGAIES